MKQNIKDFWWFTTHSWSYMQGQRWQFVIGFIPSWLSFYKLTKADR